MTRMRPLAAVEPRDLGNLYALSNPSTHEAEMLC